MAHPVSLACPSLTRPRFFAQVTGRRGQLFFNPFIGHLPSSLPVYHIQAWARRARAPSMIRHSTRSTRIIAPVFKFSVKYRSSRRRELHQNGLPSTSARCGQGSVYCAGSFGSLQHFSRLEVVARRTYLALLSRADYRMCGRVGVDYCSSDRQHLEYG
jgi:hypothetical protein